MYKHAVAQVKLSTLSETDASARFRENLSKLISEFGTPELNITDKEVLRHQNVARRKLLSAGLRADTVSRLPKLILNYPDPLRVYRKWCELSRWRDESKRSTTPNVAKRLSRGVSSTVEPVKPANQGKFGILGWHGDSSKRVPRGNRAAAENAAGLAYRPPLTAEEREKKRQAKALRREGKRVPEVSTWTKWPVKGSTNEVGSPVKIPNGRKNQVGSSIKMPIGKKKKKKKSKKQKKSGDMYSAGIRLPGSGFSRS